tara:strand:+ start:6009 stop:7343 length:1335 start_codon:yes stop_codon:yes gene_type:complete
MGNQQTELLKNARKFFSSFDNTNFYPHNNSIFYLVTTSTFIGSYLLNSLSKRKSSNFFSNSLVVIKDILYSLNYNNHRIYKSEKNLEYDKIIVTWAFENNFDKNGSLNDRYFNINSKNLKKTLWFVIYLSEKIPKKINDNIVLFKPLTSKSFNLLTVLNNITKNSFFLFKNFKYFLALVSNYNYFADIFLKHISEFINQEVKLILMPFEGQPFQNKLVNLVKKEYKNIKTIGYIHSPPLPIPSNFIFKNGSPDKIILNGNDQIYCFTKLLGWKRSNIKFLPSYRFHKSTRNNTKNTIFLPLTIKDTRGIVERLKTLDQKNIINLKKFKIKNHPGATSSKKNLFLIKKIKNLIYSSDKKNKGNIKKKFSIFIGNSGSIIESLERGLEVIQVCDDYLLDVYSSKIWPSIKTTKIDEYIYTYKLKKKGNLIKLGTKKNNLKKIFLRT